MVLSKAFRDQASWPKPTWRGSGNQRKNRNNEQKLEEWTVTGNTTKIYHQVKEEKGDLADSQFLPMKSPKLKALQL